MTDREYSDAEVAPFVGIVPSNDGRQLEVTLPDGDGGTISGFLTSEQARSITLGLRGAAAEIDGKPFFDGGWSTAEALRYAASELEELSEQYYMTTRHIENARFEGSRNEGPANQRDPSVEDS